MSKFDVLINRVRQYNSIEETDKIIRGVATHMNISNLTLTDKDIYYAVDNVFNPLCRLKPKIISYPDYKKAREEINEFMKHTWDPKGKRLEHFNQEWYSLLSYEPWRTELKNFVKYLKANEFDSEEICELFVEHNFYYFEEEFAKFLKQK